MKLVYYRDDEPTPLDLPITSRTGDVFTLAAAPTGDPVYVVAIIGGQPWLVASKR